MIMTKARKKQVVIVMALAAIMAITGTAAYFTASEEAVNSWTVGKVDIDLQETEYDKHKEEESKDITPNMELHKDPKAVNTGNNDAFIFMKVRIPKATVKVASQTGNVTATATSQELFDYQWNNGWTVIDTQEVKEAEATYQEYVVAFGTANECTALKPGETTPVLFLNSNSSHIASPGAAGIITFKNIIEGQGLENVQLNLNVETYAIQADNLTTEDTKNPTRVWGIITAQTAA